MHVTVEYLGLDGLYTLSAYSSVNCELVLFLV